MISVLFSVMVKYDFIALCTYTFAKVYFYLFSLDFYQFLWDYFGIIIMISNLSDTLFIAIALTVLPIDSRQIILKSKRHSYKDYINQRNVP